MKRIAFLFALFVMMTTISCNSSRNEEQNPLLSEWDTPYGVPPFDKIKVSHYAPAFEVAMEEHLAEIDNITRVRSVPDFENTVLAYDNAGQRLEQVALIFGMLSAAETNAQMQAVEAEMMPRLAAHSDRIMLNEELFNRIKAVYDRRKEFGLDAEQLRLVEKTYTDFVRSGALLQGDERERLKQINEELSTTSVKYSQNLLAENNAYQLLLESRQLTGIPASIRDMASERAQEAGHSGKYLFTLHKPSLIPFLTYAEDRALRQTIYEAYLNRCNNDNESNNNSLINDFIRLRVEKAKLLGYKSYADYVISNEMASTTGAVYSLLEEIWTPALERAKAEVEEMRPLFEKDHPGEEFASWDWWYYAEKLRKQNYALDEEMLRPYFSLEAVRGGIFFLANRLYGISFRPISVPIYHSEVSAYEVIDTDNSHIGVLYFDYHPRDGKGQGAWCGNYVEQRYVDGKRVAPVVAIVCNFTRPTESLPSLLTLDEAETLFHEFGHALHFLFHDVKYRGLSEVEGDFVELPSQVMENWAFHPELLKHYAVHHRTGEVISESIIQKMQRSELFNQGFMTTELIAASLSDLDIHSMTEYTPFDPMAFERHALYVQREMIPAIEPRYRYPYFSHIFDGGYSAGYYFYTWAEVLDKDAFEAFRESGDLFNREVAARLRRLLEQGGSKPGMVLYREFRGKDPDKTAMLIGRGLMERPVEEPKSDVKPAIEAPTAEKIDLSNGWR